MEVKHPGWLSWIFLGGLLTELKDGKWDLMLMEQDAHGQSSRPSADNGDSRL